MANQLKVYRNAITLILVLGSMLLVAASANAQTYLNTITFENGSGENAMVKLIGPENLLVQVGNGMNSTVRVPAGSYYIVVRYGYPGHYSYSKGDPFSVVQYGNRYSVIRITLHKVINGNYHTHPASADDFGGR